MTIEATVIGRSFAATSFFRRALLPAIRRRVSSADPAQRSRRLQILYHAAPDRVQENFPTLPRNRLRNRIEASARAPERRGSERQTRVTHREGCRSGSNLRQESSGRRPDGSRLGVETGTGDGQLPGTTVARRSVLPLAAEHRADGMPTGFRRYSSVARPLPDSRPGAGPRLPAETGSHDSLGRSHRCGSSPESSGLSTKQRREQGSDETGGAVEAGSAELRSDVT
jgi:hypothetical protein